jgi:signal transduction histidine kinase
VADISASLLEVIDGFRPRAERLGIALDTQAMQTIEKRRVDLGGLQAALKNLIENALKYGKDATRIEIALGVVDGQLQLVVEDDGPGVEPSQSTKVFERFVRGTAEHGKSRTRGSGIGLAIVAEVARKHGGTAKVEAGAHGRFTRFVMRLADMR